jgi:hypothetical protein
VLVVAEPGDLQVQAALQPLAGSLADGAVVVQAASSACSAAFRNQFDGGFLCAGVARL